MSATRLMMLGCPDVLAARIDAQITAQASDADELVASGLHPVTAAEVARCINSLTNDSRPLIALGVQPHLANEIVKLTAEGAGLVFDNDFTQGYLDPRITFTRPGDSYRIVNGVLTKYDPNEPVLIAGAGLDTRPAETNQANVSAMFGEGVTLSASTIPLPTDGETVYGVRIQESATNSAHRLFVPYSPVPDGKVTAGFLVDTSELGGRNFAIAAASSASYGDAGVRAVFDAQGQYVGRFPAGSGDPEYTVTPLSGGWLLVTRTGSKSGDTDKRVQIEIVDGLTEVFAGNGTSALHIGFPQFNVGDPIPPIPTTTGAVTRPADNALIQGAAFSEVLNPAEGAVVLRYQTELGQDNVPPAFQLRGATPGNTDVLYAFVRPNGGLGITWHVDNIQTASLTPAATFAEAGTIAWAWDASGMQVFARGSKEGVLITPDKFRASGWARFALGNSGVGGNPNSKSTYSRLRFFTRRPSDAQMMEWTS